MSCLTHNMHRQNIECEKDRRSRKSKSQARLMVTLLILVSLHVHVRVFLCSEDFRGHRVVSLLTMIAIIDYNCMRNSILV